MILEFPELTDSLNPALVKEAAKKYFDTENFVQVVLKPDKSYR